MSINFPNSPTLGQLWPNPAQAGLPVYQWDGEKWLTTPTPTGSVASFAQFEFTATAGQTTFSGLDINGATLAYSAGYISVFVNGDRINKADFIGTNGTSIVFAIGRIVNDQVTIVALNTAPIANALMNSNNLSDVASPATARGNLGAIGSVKVQTFTASGTYTPSPGMINCLIECVGGGGAGGGAAASGAGNQNAGGGGGGGGYARLLASAATVGVSKAVTVGAAGLSGAIGNNPGGNGGDSSVGAICIAKGGTGGVGSATGSNSGGGGAGGIVGTGNLSMPGQNGQQGFPGATSAIFFQTSGSGGNAAGGFGAGGLGTSANTNGTDGQLYGGGGSGGTDFNNTGNKRGGVGAAGVVIITEYCTQ